MVLDTYYFVNFVYLYSSYQKKLIPKLKELSIGLPSVFTAIMWWFEESNLR